MSEITNIPEEFGDCDAIRARIFARVTSEHISQKELAERLEVSPQTITDWKKGKSNSFTGKMGPLSFVLRTTPAWLYCGVGEADSDRAFADTLMRVSDEAFERGRVAAQLDSSQFISRVTHYAADRGISLDDAVKKSGLSCDVLSNLSGNISIPSVADVQRLAQYLGVTTSELLGENKKGPDTPKGAEPMDPIDARLMGFVRQLSPEQKKSLIEKMEFLLAMQ